MRFAFSSPWMSLDVHRLTLLCHAAAARTQPVTFPEDRPLDEDVRSQLPQGGTRFSKAGRCLTSPLLRARQTAEGLGLVAEEEDALRDLHLGRWEGRALHDIHAAEPEAVAAWLSDPEAAPHGGESRAALRVRISDWLGVQVGTRGHTLCVTHAAVIRAAVLLMLDAPADAFFRLDVEPLSLTEISHDGRRWALRSLNVPWKAWASSV
ncbi:histidine phosphatase family protein [Aquabacter cavernae]|uniref:histidine phosphatase family protein n=1 Tax=Aquabacter cavernae TaxID=2496029 RepID=UPI001FE075B1|nr:histidine phosphatase family protein [Aquabacter cavernae]